MNQKRGRRKKESLKPGVAFQNLVGEIAMAFSPGATVDTGQWVEGPDGLRELDVSVRGVLGARPLFVLIECKDYTYSKRPKPVGIGDIDEFE